MVVLGPRATASASPGESGPPAVRTFSRRRESATQLSVRVPFGKTNIPEGAGVLYLGICDAYPARRPRKQRRSSRASTVYFSHDREDLTVRNAPYLTAESPADARLVHGQPFGADCAEMSGVEFLRTIMWVAKPFFPPGFSCSEHAMVPVRVQH